MAKKQAAKKTAKVIPTGLTAQAGLASKIKPLADRIVIKEDSASAEKQTLSGIIIPAGADSDKGGKRGEVVAIGPGRTEDGKLIAPAVKAGDTVIFQWGDKVRIGEDDYYIVRESEILAIVK